MQLFHPELHTLFETLAYLSGYAVYKAQRARIGDALNDTTRWQIIAAAAIGALLGSRILGVLEQWPRLHAMHVPLWQTIFLPGGKTIVGGLLGGWIAVEIAKRLMYVRSRTGDLFAVPLCIGIAVGRVGCFLAGISDDTYGNPTTLPWGVNFGDGIHRHPTQLYEIAFLLVLAVCCRRMSRRPHAQGSVFRLFLAAYLAFRLLIDFLKPQPLFGPLNLIQWACMAGLCVIALEHGSRYRSEHQGALTTDESIVR